MKRILIFLLILGACSRKAPSAAGQDLKLLEMSKSPCFGFCPVYQLTVFENGTLRLNAKQNMKWTGMHTAQLSKEDLKSLKSSLSRLQLQNYQSEYREPIADAPATEITYYQGQTTKKIFTNFKFPDALQMVIDSLDQKVINGNWEKWEDPRVVQEFIVNLINGEALGDLIKKYKSYELIMVKRLDPTTNHYWLLSSKVMPGEEMQLLNKLKKEIYIKEVQLNKTLETNR